MVSSNACAGREVPREDVFSSASERLSRTSLAVMSPAIMGIVFCFSIHEVPLAFFKCVLILKD